ncbi:MAG: copper transporter [Actinomycetia bacterium]|nr:copper transporter [Actinomycetes bacterium]
MYNLRYHIVSIVSVFLALALGLVLGGLIGNKTPAAIQSGLIKSVNQAAQKAREERDQAVAENTRLTTFGQDSLALLTKGRLQGKTVLVLGAQGDGNKRVIDLLGQAGARAVVADLQSDHYSATDKNSATSKLVADLKTRYKQTDDLAALAAGFSAEWTRAGTTSVTGPGTSGAAARPVTAALQKDGILTMSGDTGGVLVFDGVVDVATGSKNTADGLALQLALAFDRHDVAVIVAQMSGETSTLGPEGAKLELSATDLLGTPPGDWTVVAVLGGAEPAIYGTLQGATQAYPPLK